MSKLTPERLSLLEQARWSARNAYAPASEFRVGAVIVSVAGRMFTGANVENASYSISICAERVALFKAVSEGEREFTELAVVAETDAGETDASPCGACRQALQEFSPGLKITYRQGGGYVTRTLAELLPDPFGNSDDDG
jgi:cytidine deaminase